MIIQAVTAISLLALIHDWYPKECCSDKDCHPIASERVMTQPNGYYIDGGKFFVPLKEARPSPDGGYHGCEAASMPLFPQMATPHKLRCFFAPIDA